jgi:mRNA interferase RelE/StbE
MDHLARDLILLCERKLAGYEDRYRLRVGDYRVIYEVIDQELVILVVGVGHRREIYRAMS